MKKLPYAEYKAVLDSIADGADLPEGIETADACSYSHEDIFAGVDDQLKAIGYQLVMYETGGDEYAWKIEKIKG